MYVNNNTISLRGELYRKLIHFSSAVIPVGYYYIDKMIVLIILSSLVILSLLVEFLKYRSNIVYGYYMKIFGVMLREHEYDISRFRVTGATWVLLSCIFCIILFPKIIAISGMLMLSFADSSSALAGRIFGKKKITDNRTFIGTLVFILAGFTVIIFSPKYLWSFKEYMFYFVAVITTAIIDILKIPIDDNFTIPVSFCLIIYIFYKLFFPGLAL